MDEMSYTLISRTGIVQIFNSKAEGRVTGILTLSPTNTVSKPFVPST